VNNPCRCLAELQREEFLHTFFLGLLPGGLQIVPSPCVNFWNPLHCHIRSFRNSLEWDNSMNYDPANPLIVQGDRTVLVEVDNPRYAAARDALAPFAELEKSPEHIHTYRLTPLSLWNAAAAGMTAEAMLEVLSLYSKFPLPNNLAADLKELVERYGRVRIERYELQGSPAA
jgi:hypothetical protein